MNKSKLGLDQRKVDRARSLAKQIAEDVQSFADGYTTVAVERTICRLLGIDGVDENQVPLPNVVVDALKGAGVLNQGVMFYIDKQEYRRHSHPHGISTHIFMTLAVLGGSLGELLGMWAFRHKRHHKEYLVLLPIFLFLQIIVALQLSRILHFVSS